MVPGRPSLSHRLRRSACWAVLFSAKPLSGAAQRTWVPQDCTKSLSPTLGSGSPISPIVQPSVRSGFFFPLNVTLRPSIALTSSASPWMSCSLGSSAIIATATGSCLRLSLSQTQTRSPTFNCSSRPHQPMILTSASGSSGHTLATVSPSMSSVTVRAFGSTAFSVANGLGNNLRNSAAPAISLIASSFLGSSLLLTVDLRLGVLCRPREPLADDRVDRFEGPALELAVHRTAGDVPGRTRCGIERPELGILELELHRREHRRRTRNGFAGIRRRNAVRVRVGTPKLPRLRCDEPVRRHGCAIGALEDDEGLATESHR